MHTEAEPHAALQSSITGWKVDKTFAHGDSNVITCNDAARPRVYPNKLGCSKGEQNNKQFKTSASLCQRCPLGNEGAFKVLLEKGKCF